MIDFNRIHAKFYRPEKGKDPVPREYAQAYADKKWNDGVREDLIDQLEDWVFGLEGKSVLDLGGGPGQYSVALAKRGAKVVWHDISRFYLDYAKQKAKDNDVKIELSLGYMDEAYTILQMQFDLVINRICWYYSWGDSSFSKVIFNLVKPGGVCYIEANHSDWRRNQLSKTGVIKTWLNDKLSIKIGHPHPPRKRIAELFNVMSIMRMKVVYDALDGKEQIIFQKSP